MSHGEGGTVFMTAELKQLLEGQRGMTMVIERQAEQIIPWVFHRNGKPIRSFKVAWQGACERGSPAVCFMASEERQ
jgi:hypothetical protein